MTAETTLLSKFQVILGKSVAGFPHVKFGLFYCNTKIL